MSYHIDRCSFFIFLISCSTATYYIADKFGYYWLFIMAVNIPMLLILNVWNANQEFNIDAIQLNDLLATKRAWMTGCEAAISVLKPRIGYQGVCDSDVLIKLDIISYLIWLIV